MTDLFSGQEAPLADRMRPRTLAEFIGQRHLLGEGRLLRRAIEADRLTSSIFFGPPGCGKTTLASIIANSTKSAFVQLNAVTSGVADVRKVIADALDECGVWYCGGKNSPYIWLRCPGNMKSWEFFDWLLENCGVVGTPGVGFGECGEGYFRLTAFGDAEKTKMAAERIKTAIKAL